MAEIFGWITAHMAAAYIGAALAALILDAIKGREDRFIKLSIPGIACCAYVAAWLYHA